MSTNTHIKTEPTRWRKTLKPADLNKYGFNQRVKGWEPNQKSDTHMVQQVFLNLHHGMRLIEPKFDHKANDEDTLYKNQRNLDLEFKKQPYLKFSKTICNMPKRGNTCDNLNPYS